MHVEHTLYGWDAMGVWQFVAPIAYPPDHSLFSAIATFGRSMHHAYNDFCGLPSIVVMALFNSTRFYYIIANVIFLVVPAAVATCWLFVRFEAATLAQAVSVLLAYFALLAVPLPWIVTLSGGTDVGGLIMAAVVTDLLGRTDIRSQDPKRWLAIGGALAMLALSKRWFLYLVISLILVMVIDVAISFLRTCLASGSLTITAIKSAIWGPFLCGCALAFVYMMSFPLPLEIIRSNYSVAYSAYQNGTSYADAVGLNASLIASRFGLIQMALAFGCFVAALFFSPMRRAAIYLYVPGWIALLQFSRIQTLNDHHMLLLYLATIVPPLFLARQLLWGGGVKGGRPWGWAILLLAALISGLGFGGVFASGPAESGNAGFPWLSDQRLQPIQRHDLPEMEAILRFIGSKVIEPGQPPVHDVYVLSSSLLLNSSHFASAGFQMHEDLPAGNYVCVTHDVDLRDGFPDELLDAKLVVVADPLQTHLETEQKVMTVPARMFLEGTGFAQAFVRDPQVFQMDQGVRVYIFERVRPSTPEEIAELHQEVGVPSHKSAASVPEDAKL